VHRRPLRAPGRLLQPGGDVDGIACRQPLLCAGDHLAGVEPDARLEAELGKHISHLGCRPHRAQRIILVDGRHAEDRHDGVADELLYRAADSPSAVDPVTSQKSTVTVLRCMCA
jgi:hypothetical protein